MEIAALFVTTLAIVTAADLAEWRARAPADPVLGIAEMSRRFGRRFCAALEERFAGVEYDVDPGTVLDNLWDARHLLGKMNERFASLAYAYAAVALKTICELSVELIDSATVFHDTAALRGTVALPRLHDYCAITAFHDHGGAAVKYGFRTDLMLDTVFYLRTVGRPAGPTLRDARDRLEAYARSYRDDLDLRGEMPLIFGDDDDGDGETDPAVRLARLKTEIADFSNAFCSPRTPPFVGKDLVFDDGGGGDGVRNDSPFVRHVFHVESCAIDFEDFYRDDHRQNEIVSWNCENILDSEEYSFEKNAEDVTFEADGSWREAGGENSATLGRFYSLAALRHHLRTNDNGNYLNAVKYYNVAADVVLFAAVKEGRKVLEGVRLAATSGRETTISARELRGLRSALLAFMYAYDALIASMRDAKRIVVFAAGRPRAKAFGRRADAVARLLDAATENGPDADEIRRGVCDGISIVLRGRAEASLDAEPTTRVRFEEYYFSGPLLNVRKLHSFVANDFEC